MKIFEKYPKAVVKRVKGGIDITLQCEHCGEPLTNSDEYGMFCKNRCGHAEAKRAKACFERLMKAFKGMARMVGRTER